MKKIFYISFFFLLPCVNLYAAEPWSKQDKILEGMFLVTNFIDLGQSLYVADNPKRYREHNPILGSHPKRESVYFYFLSTAILHPIITHYLPIEYRVFWQSVSIIIEAGCVLNNFNIGLAISY